MALNAAALDVAGDALAGAITHISLHSADPGAGGANEIGSRVAAGWTSVDGLLTASNLAFTGLGANTPVHSVGYWSASSGGTFYGSQPRTTGDATANAAGEYTVTSITETGSAS